MSQQARDALVKKLVFQKDSQRSDLETIGVTQTNLIALLTDLTDRGWHIEITAVKTDHHDDSALGLHSHFNGYCVDCWPLASATPGDYLDADSQEFADFLADADDSAYHYQTGLAGSANTAANQEAAGPSWFPDTGGDHVHLGAK